MHYWMFLSSVECQSHSPCHRYIAKNIICMAVATVSKCAGYCTQDVRVPFLGGTRGGAGVVVLTWWWMEKCLLLGWFLVLVRSGRLDGWLYTSERTSDEWMNKRETTAVLLLFIRLTRVHTVWLSKIMIRIRARIVDFDCLLTDRLVTNASGAPPYLWRFKISCWTFTGTVLTVLWIKKNNLAWT